MSKYQISINEEKHRKASWDQVEHATIGCIPWKKFGIKYNSFAQITGFNDGFCVKLMSDEPEPLSTCTGLNDNVYCDSCLEFFLQPCKYDNRYFNFEFTAQGAMYLGVGSSRQDHNKLKPKNYIDLFEVRPVDDGNYWGIEFFIPDSFIGQYFKKYKHLSDSMRGNFYKCGDRTKNPHYLCWNYINSKAPDFHRPECFGALIPF